MTSTTLQTAVEAYALLSAESERLNLPECYKTDLTKHDREGLERLFAASEHPHFLWCLRTCGTFLVDLAPDKSGGMGVRALLRACASNGDEQSFWYEFLDGRLRGVNLDQAYRAAQVVGTSK